MIIILEKIATLKSRGIIMKKRSWILLIFACVVMFGAIAHPVKVFAYDNIGEISVIGEFSQKLSPDMATISATINQADVDLETAKNKTFEIYSNVKNAMDSNEKVSKIDLSYFTTFPNFDYSQGKTLTGYSSTLSFEFEVDGLENIQDAVNLLIENGVKSINNISYQVKDYTNQYNEILQSAIQNAVDKAKILLQKDDVSIKKIIEQETYNSCYMCRSYIEGANNDFDSQIEVSARVKVIFE